MTRRPYNPANRPIIHALDLDRVSDEARALRLALAPRPYPWAGVWLWSCVALLWLSAAFFAFLPALMGY